MLADFAGKAVPPRVPLSPSCYCPYCRYCHGALSQSLPRLRLASSPKKDSIYLYLQGKRDGERDSVTIETIATIG